MRAFTVIFVSVVLLWGVFSCITPKTNHRRVSQSSSDTTTTVFAADGLDLKALAVVVKNVENAEQLEKELNKPDGINNMDLNEDGKVDFIKVSEYGNKKAYGFSLTVEPAEGEVQEIATIEITRDNDNANVQVSGNNRVYGSGHTYHSHFPIGSFLLWSYLLSPHPYYYSPWRYGYYPGYWGRGWSPVGRSTYTTRTRTVTRNANVSRATGSQVRNTGLTSPNSGKTANKGIRKSLANPTRSQRQFQARNPSKAVRSGGFGKNASTGRGSRSSSGRAFGGRGK